MSKKPCRVCSHPSRLAIDTALLNNKTLSRVALDFGFTYTRGSDGRTMAEHKVVQAHRDRCIPDAYQTAMREGKVENGVALATELKSLSESVSKVLRRAETGRPMVDADGVPLLDDDGNPKRHYEDKTILAAVREGRANLELAAKLAGQLPDADPSNLDGLRRSLENPKVRRLLAEIDRVSATDD